VPIDVRFGAGAIRELPEVLDGLAARRVLIVASVGTRRRVGGTRGLLRGFAVRACGWFGAFAPNPDIDAVRAGVVAARALGADTVVAVGGGTALDLGKLIALFAGRDEDPERYVLGDAALGEGRSLRLVLAPTTSGTGSEVTSFAVVYIGTAKHSVDAPAVRADVALIDPELTWSMPPHLTAVTAADALSQAIESYWCVRSTDASRALAGEAARIVLERLGEACGPAPSAATRALMSRAALLAGQAIDVTRTTAPHAVSYPLTALFGIAHGHACALTLPHFLAYNARATADDVLDARGASFVTRRVEEILALLDAATPEDGRDRLVRLFARAGLPMRLGQLGVRPGDVGRVVENAFNPQRVGNNPRRVTAHALRGMLHSIL
jgi:alcohol dehydrogenase class IV